MKRYALLILLPALILMGCGGEAPKDKFQMEVEKEAGAVKLVREVERGGYDVVATEKLKNWIDSGKEMVIVDTMPFEASYKKAHIPGAVQFLFPIPDMNEWDTNLTDGRTQEDFIKLLGDDKDKLIVIYCGFVKCTRSHNGPYGRKNSATQTSTGIPAGSLRGKVRDTRRRMKSNVLVSGNSIWE